jgi:hypothetical protein
VTRINKIRSGAQKKLPNNPADLKIGPTQIKVCRKPAQFVKPLGDNVALTGSKEDAKLLTEDSEAILRETLISLLQKHKISDILQVLSTLYKD